MNSLNKVLLIGRVSHVSHDAAEQTIVTITTDAERSKTHRVYADGKLGEAVRNVEIGRLIYVEGSLETILILANVNNFIKARRIDVLTKGA
jgi:single-stranded DNA-binding protein